MNLAVQTADDPKPATEIEEENSENNLTSVASLI